MAEQPKQDPKQTHNFVQQPEEAQDLGQEAGSEDEESMSLKDVIMTLNEFYSVKLEGVLKLIALIGDESQPVELEKLEKQIKDNEVRIPYDEDIFVGIDQNYKIFKKILLQVKECLKVDSKSL